MKKLVLHKVRKLQGRCTKVRMAWIVSHLSMVTLASNRPNTLQTYQLPLRTGISPFSTQFSHLPLPSTFSHPVLTPTSYTKSPTPFLTPAQTYMTPPSIIPSVMDCHPSCPAAPLAASPLVSHVQDRRVCTSVAHWSSSRVPRWQLSPSFGHWSPRTAV